MIVDGFGLLFCCPYIWESGDLDNRAFLHIMGQELPEKPFGKGHTVFQQNVRRKRQRLSRESPFFFISMS